MRYENERYQTPKLLVLLAYIGEESGRTAPSAVFELLKKCPRDALEPLKKLRAGLKVVLKQLLITYAVLRRWELFDLQADWFLIHFG